MTSTGIGRRTEHVALLVVSCVMVLLFGSRSEAAPLSLALDENFTDISLLGAEGWSLINNSSPIGTTDWFQGNTGVFTSGTGDDSYIAANFNNADFGGTISNWLLTPELTLDNGVQISFATRTEASSFFPDRLEMRMSTSGGSSDVGVTENSVGDFTTLLLTLNPALAFGGYPEDWATFTATISGLSGPTQGRIAFRYFVSDTSANANYIGIDSVQVGTRVPEPGTLMSLLIGMGFVAAVTRRHFRFSR